MLDSIYLDNGATTPPDPEILSGMVALQTAYYGNTSSAHQLGIDARKKLESSRQKLAQAFGAKAREVTFTGGGTEAITLAIIGSAGDRPGRIAYSQIEHSAVKESARWLKEKFNWVIDEIPVDGHGLVTESTLRATLNEETRIVATMMVNNEIGSINDISSISRVVRSCAPRARLVVDAVQGFGKIPFKTAQLGADCVAIAAHKLHGPKGCGALWSRHELQPIAKGGGQEFGRRGGTPSLAHAWALAEAHERQKHDAAKIEALRDELWRSLSATLPDITLTGCPFGPTRIYNNIHICIPGLPTEPVINALSSAGVFVSGGSACSSGRFSAVLHALGRRPEDGAYLRLTLGRFNRREEIPIVVDKLAAVVQELRSVYL
ncbi:MAG: cysteine desulfurase family protein [Myxococcota bacterium]|nr:cysteine desulfurase family protein [Myxococcota bacterium]